VSWQIVPVAQWDMLSSTDTAAAQRAFTAMLGMKKLDIAALQRAYESV
jgi:predicted 3-demethylubiquinone-9 3-methyltransferase (glyoxalase superfamily)